MTSTLKYFSKHWNLIRTLRLIASLLFLYLAFSGEEPLITGIIGLLLLIQAITNSGCGGSSSCSV